jgi:hypothetical protein
MKGDPEFVILKYQAWMEASEFEETILGAIVKEPLSPSTNYVPDSPLKYKTHEPQKGSATDFVLANAGDTANELGASLKSIGGYSVSGNKEDSVHLAGKFIRYKRIQQLDQFWAKLKEDADVKKTAPGWISFFNTWPVCLVVGIMICEDVELSMDGAQSRTHEGNVELPIGQITLAAGVPNPVSNLVDPQVKLASTKQTAAIFKAKMGKSSIFAVELRKVTTGMFRQKELQLKSDGPEVDSTRLAGDESDDEEDLSKPVVTEDLILDELGPEDYEDMVS